MIEGKGEATMRSAPEKRRLRHAPRVVSDRTGRVTDVILDYDDYHTLIEVLAEVADWEKLPAHLQDEVDALLIDRAKQEQGDRPLTPLDEVIADLEDARRDAA